MAKRVFIVHRWAGSPDADWYPWLKKELENKGFQVFVPAMPKPDTPEIFSWITTLMAEVGKPDEETYFVGHSVGCQTILRYLEALQDAKVGGAVFVAGWTTLTGLGEEEKEIAKPWVKSPINFESVLQKTKNMIAIFSDNDPYVPLAENKKVFGKFCKKVIVEKGQGHFDEDTKIFEAPIVLKTVLEIVQ